MSTRPKMWFWRVTRRRNRDRIRVVTEHMGMLNDSPKCRSGRQKLRTRLFKGSPAARSGASENSLSVVSVYSNSTTGKIHTDMAFRININNFS